MKNEELDEIIEKSFKTGPDFHLTFDFAENVTFAVARREQWKADLYEYLNIAGILVFLLAVVCGTYYLVNKDLLLQIYAFVSQNLLQVAAVVFLLNFILFADRVLLRLLFNRWSRS